MTTILLARHGESDWNVELRWQGHADRPLTARGRIQAEALAERLADIELDAIYSSDLRRARETAEAVAATRGLDVHADPGLREVDVGSWSGLTRLEAKERFPDEYATWLNGGPGWRDGETYVEMTERVLAAVRRIVERHLDGTVLVVAHGGPIRAIHASALGMDVHAYRRMRPVEPNARLSAVCAENGLLTRVCHGVEIEELIAAEEERRAADAAKPPSPAG